LVGRREKYRSAAGKGNTSGVLVRKREGKKQPQNDTYRDGL